MGNTRGHVDKTEEKNKVNIDGSIPCPRQTVVLTWADGLERQKADLNQWLTAEVFLGFVSSKSRA